MVIVLIFIIIGIIMINKSNVYTYNLMHVSIPMDMISSLNQIEKGGAPLEKRNI